MTKIAVPTENGILNAHFGHTKEMMFFDTEGKEITNVSISVPPPHEPGSIPKWVKEMGADVLIAGGLGQKAIQIFEQVGVDLKYGAPVKEARKLVEDYLNGTLECTGEGCNHHH